MTDRQIISLLKRYMDGATTVEEETALAEFFCTATDATDLTLYLPPTGARTRDVLHVRS